MDFSVQAHVIHETVIINVDHFHTGLDAALQSQDARRCHRRSWFHLLRTARRAGFAIEAQPDRLAVEHRIGAAQADAVHHLGRFKIHLVRERTTRGTFTALETQVDVLTAEGLDFVSESHVHSL